MGESITKRKRRRTHMEATSRIYPSMQLGSRDGWGTAQKETNGAGLTGSVWSGCLYVCKGCVTKNHTRIKAQTRLSQVRLDIGLLCIDCVVDMGFLDENLDKDIIIIVFLKRHFGCYVEN